MNVYLPNLRLPSAYQEVEYIQSSGTQYINTGLTLNPAITYEFQFQLTSTANEQGIIGARGNGGNTYRNSLMIYNSVFHFMIGDNAGWNGNVDLNKHTVKLTGGNNNWSINVDGTDYASTGTVNTSSSIPYYIFTNGFNNVSYVKMYYVKFYSSGTLVRNFVPCYRKSDNVSGMYDLVNNQFYTNSGTGTFTKGADVYMSELKNAYIGEYKQPSEETYTTNFTQQPGTTLQITNKGIIEKIEATFSVSSLGSNSLWFGMYNPSSPNGSGIYFQNDGRFYVEVPIGTRIQSFSPFTTTTYKITYTSSSITINVGGTDNVVSLNSSQSAIISNFFNLGTIYIDTRIDGSSYITVSPVTIKIKYKQN